MIFDLHVHTRISECSRLTLSDILSNGKSKGLDGVCITDHQTMNIRHSHVKEGIQEDGLCVIFGMEYETPDGDFLIFGPFEKIQKDLSARDLLHTVKTKNGVAIAAHPFRKGRSVSEYIAREKLCDIVEVVNGRNSDEENHKAEKWIKQYHMKIAAGSDAHMLSELGKIKIDIGDLVVCRQTFIQALKKSTIRLIL